MKSTNLIYKKNTVIDKYTLLKFIDGGCNGEVWKVKDEKGNIFALKVLKRLSNKSYQRFKDEIQLVINNLDIKGILPIFDYFIPNTFKKERPWYVMPIAVPLLNHLPNSNIDEIIIKFINLAKTFFQLHQRNIFHRDIKPANLFLYDGRPCVGDFGIVDFPEKKELTRKNESVGPKWTIAPEMKRDPNNAEGSKADSYSLAKTLWIFMTKEKLSFEGKYNNASIESLSKYFTNEYLKPLEEILEKCTSNDPNERLNMLEISNSLQDWLSVRRNFEDKNKLEWQEVQNILFPTAIPSRSEWVNLRDIIHVLNVLSKSTNLNHMFLPYGGGLDFHKAEYSAEEGCIEINCGGLIYILKPNKLMFESFNTDPQWNYFRIETINLDPIKKHENATKFNEEAPTEIYTGKYTDYECYEYNEFQGKTLPNSARQVFRILNGSFVFFSKTSHYNKDTSTYDGRHNRYDSESFRSYIERSAIKISPTKSNIKPTVQIKYEENIYIRKGRNLTTSEIQILNKVITFANKWILEEEELKKKYDIDQYGLEIGSEKSFQFLSEYRPNRDLLHNHINSLSDNDIRLVAAVMYAGRNYMANNRCHSLEEMLNFFSKSKHLAHSILEKVSLARYLENGMHAYS